MQLFPLRNHLRKGKLQDAAGTVDQTGCIQQHVVHLGAGEHFQPLNPNRSLGEQITRLCQQGVGVVEIVHALIAQHHTIAGCCLFRLPLQRKIDHQRTAHTASRRQQRRQQRKEKAEPQHIKRNAHANQRDSHGDHQRTAGVERRHRTAENVGQIVGIRIPQKITERIHPAHRGDHRIIADESPCQQVRRLLLGNIREHTLLLQTGHHITAAHSTAHHQNPSHGVAEQRQQGTGQEKMDRFIFQHLRRDYRQHCAGNLRKQRKHCHAVAVSVQTQKIPQSAPHRRKSNRTAGNTHCQLQNGIAAQAEVTGNKGENTACGIFAKRQQSAEDRQQQQRQTAEQHHIPQLQQGAAHLCHVVRCGLSGLLGCHAGANPPRRTAGTAGLLLCLIVEVLFLLPVVMRGRFGCSGSRIRPLENTGHGLLGIGGICAFFSPALLLFFLSGTCGIRHLPDVRTMPVLALRNILLHLDSAVIGGDAVVGISIASRSCIAGVHKGNLLPL